MGKSKTNVQVAYLMGTTMLVLCLVPIIDGLLDRRFCDADGLCSDNEDESRYYSDRRVDRLDQDQEQRLLLFNRAERDQERSDERRTDERNERLARRERISDKRFVMSDERQDSRQMETGRQDRHTTYRSDEIRAERMSDRFDYRSEDRRSNDEERRSRFDDREERFDDRRERDFERDDRREQIARELEREDIRSLESRVQDRQCVERLERDVTRESEREDTRSVANRNHDRLDRLREENTDRRSELNGHDTTQDIRLFENRMQDRLDRQREENNDRRVEREATRESEREAVRSSGIRMQDRLDRQREDNTDRRAERMDRDTTREDRRDINNDDDRRARQQVQDVRIREEYRGNRNQDRFEPERVDRSENRAINNRLDRARVDERREARRNDHFRENRIDTERVVDQIHTNDYNSMPFLWNIVQGALITFIGLKIMKKNKIDGNWKPIKFAELMKQRETAISCH